MKHTVIAPDHMRHMPLALQVEALIGAQKGGMVRDMMRLLGLPDRFKPR